MGSRESPRNAREAGSDSPTEDASKLPNSDVKLVSPEDSSRENGDASRGQRARNARKVSSEEAENASENPRVENAKKVSSEEVENASKRVKNAEKASSEKA